MPPGPRAVIERWQCMQFVFQTQSRRDPASSGSVVARAHLTQKAVDRLTIFCARAAKAHYGNYQCIGGRICQPLEPLSCFYKLCLLCSVCWLSAQSGSKHFPGIGQTIPSRLTGVIVARLGDIWLRTTR